MYVDAFACCGYVFFQVCGEISKIYRTWTEDGNTIYDVETLYIFNE